MTEMPPRTRSKYYVKEAVAAPLTRKAYLLGMRLAPLFPLWATDSQYIGFMCGVLNKPGITILCSSAYILNLLGLIFS